MELTPRLPFGEGNRPSQSEAFLAGKSFRTMMDGLLRAPETHGETDGNTLYQDLELKIGVEDHPGMKALLYHRTDLGSGECGEKVGLYECGDKGEDWGPKVCDLPL